MQEGTVEVEGGSLAWKRVGQGEPLLLLNGYAATKDDWDPTFLEGLAAGREVICPDPRGTGGSEAPVAGLTVERIAGDYLALLDALGVERAAVVGWSMGGFAAQALAASAPERVEHLVLLSTDPGGPGAVPRTAEADARLRDHSGSPDEQARRLLGLLFPPEVAATIYDEFGELVAEARRRLAPETLAAQEAAMDRWHQQPADRRLAAIRAPVLAAAAGEDEVIPPANAELLAARLPGSWLARFPGCGHAFMAEQPGRLAALIGAFLQRPTG